MSSCTRASCGGSIATDGYCDTCGYAGAPASSSPPTPTPKPQSPPQRASSPPPPAVRTPPPPGSKATPQPSPAGHSHPPVAAHAEASEQPSCTELGCGGQIAGDGYCNTCGLQPSQEQSPTAAPSAPSAAGSTHVAPPKITIAAPLAPDTSRRIANATGGDTSARTRTARTTSARAELGAGLVRIAPTIAGDPSSAVMDEAKIASVLGEKPEEDRNCSVCGQPVGRGHAGEPGRVKGFCGNCRTPFDFVTNRPQLNAGDLVGGQYKILGPLAHGGMGWIYLGQDTAVSNRWVVLKGLLNEDDVDAVASAVAERQFLARIEHGSIVNIYNFVTWAGAGYIVMEYVGGESLNQKLKDRRSQNGGEPNPLPLTQAIAYVLGVLPAIGYLHDQALVYNDFKPANVMAVADGVKLIDVGGVMQANDETAAIFGTRGFQAPEVASMGPSVASDLYTVGRTLAVLSLNFVFHTGAYQYELPTPAEEPIFSQYESLYRFLLKSTAAHPDDRFQDAGEMAQQLLGVLREIVARQERTPKPTTSSLFGGDRLAGLLLVDDTDNFADWRALPVPKINPDDPAAPFLAELPELDAKATLGLIDKGMLDGTAVDSVEIRLRRAREMIEDGQTAEWMLQGVAHSDAWNWRITWFQGIESLRDGNAEAAAEFFSAVWTELPGELAPKLATALAAESAEAFGRAAQLYAEVISVDASYVSAAFGLARCRVAEGDRQGAVTAYGEVPASSATYTEAQVATARVLTQYVEDAPPTPADLVEASAAIESARIDSAERGALAIEVLERTLDGVENGGIDEEPFTQIFGNPLTPDGLRTSLEQAYRNLSKLAETPEERFALVDKANAIRVPSWL